MGSDDAEGLLTIRWSTGDDAASLASLHADAWRYAYAGIIPGLTLERALARRGGGWWRRMHDRGFRALALDFGGTLAGYATLGRSRGAPSVAAGGEIYELYVRPEYHGCGIGRRLFAEARARLGRHGLDGLLVWALADNAVGCRFYGAMGGRECARAEDRFCGIALEKVGFTWP